MININLYKRLVTSITLIIILIFGLFYNDISWKLLIIFFVIFCFYEFYNIINKIFKNKIYKIFINFIFNINFLSKYFRSKEGWESSNCNYCFKYFISNYLTNYRFFFYGYLRK